MELDITREEMLNELKYGSFGDGDLTLIIACTKCQAIFELSKESVALALMSKATFIEYLKFVQHSKCRICREKVKDET